MNFRTKWNRTFNLATSSLNVNLPNVLLELIRQFAIISPIEQFRLKYGLPLSLPGSATAAKQIETETGTGTTTTTNNDNNTTDNVDNADKIDYYYRCEFCEITGKCDKNQNRNINNISISIPKNCSSCSQCHRQYQEIFSLSYCSNCSNSHKENSNPQPTLLNIFKYDIKYGNYTFANDICFGTESNYKCTWNGRNTTVDFCNVAKKDDDICIVRSDTDFKCNFCNDWLCDHNIGILYAPNNFVRRDFDNHNISYTLGTNTCNNCRNSLVIGRTIIDILSSDPSIETFHDFKLLMTQTANAFRSIKSTSD